MNSFEIEQYNPIYLYEALLSEIISKIKPILSMLNASSASWLSSLIDVLKKRPLQLLELLTKKNLSVTDLKLYIIQSRQESDVIFALEQMVPESCKAFITVQLETELLELRGYFKKVNEKLFTSFPEAMITCLDRDLRKFSIDLFTYFEPSDEGDYLNINKLSVDIAKLAETDPLAVKIQKELSDCVEILPPVDLNSSCAITVNYFYEAIRIATKLDETCITHQCRRLNYLFQRFDISNVILKGFCDADAKIWSKVTSEPPPIELASKFVSFKYYEQLHQLTSSEERVRVQIKEEIKTLKGGSPILNVESKLYKIKIPLNLMKEIQNGIELTGQSLIKIKAEARKLAELALKFALIARNNHHNDTVFCMLKQAGLGNGHVISFKFVEKNSKLYGQFRDANAGTFEFDFIDQFLNWFSDFYHIMNYHIHFNGYSFSYPAPLSYSRGYEWLISQNRHSNLQLALYCQQQLNDFNENTGSEGLQLYRKIKQPNNFNRKQVIFLLLAASFSLTEKNPSLAIQYVTIAENLIRDTHLPRTMLDTLLYANIYQQLSHVHLIKGNISDSFQNYQKLDLFLSRCQISLPRPLTDQLQLILKKFKENQSIDNLKIIDERLDIQFTTLNTALQNYFSQRLYAIIEQPIQYAEFQLERLYNYSYNIQQQGLYLFQAMQKKWLNMNRLTAQKTPNENQSAENENGLILAERIRSKKLR